MGPMVSHRRLAAVQKLIEDAVSAGATVATGGRPIDGQGVLPPADRAQPTCPPARRSCTREPFGPVAPRQPRSTTSTRAIEVANALPYGLAAYGYTDSAATAEKLIAGYEAGILSINHCGGSMPQAPSAASRRAATAGRAGPRGSRASW